MKLQGANTLCNMHAKSGITKVNRIILGKQEKLTNADCTEGAKTASQLQPQFSD